MAVCFAAASSSGASSASSMLLDLPPDVLVGQLLACSTLDLVRLTAAAAPRWKALALSVVQAVLERDGIDMPAFRRLSSEQQLQLFHFLHCASLPGRGRASIGHLCPVRPEFVRYAAVRCVMQYGDEELDVDVGLVGRVSTWLDDVSRGVDRISLPLPPIVKLQAKSPIEAIAPVTRAGQVLAVLPRIWGETQAAGPAGASSSLFTCSPLETAERMLQRMAETLDKKGECAVLRTHTCKVHIFSAQQAKAAGASSYNPILSKVLNALGVSAPLYATVYLQRDPGLFCFN
eukprot:TRINITY_DN36321_c0_g1_i1.p1 TRINITY_DN36321_c0_g1~~TRINITY_DN36321_c0_g1_i1.p1  ORF type:complete len:298 (-),score=69.89 TRINITY_DN36321_c0_g1_i1:112-978(-)